MVAQTRHRVPLTAAVLLALGVVLSGQLSETTKNLAKGAVVMINAEGDVGAGVIVGTSSTEVYIATAYHFVSQKQNVQVTFAHPPGARTQGKVLDLSNPELDLGVIAVPMPPNADVKVLAGLGAAHSSALTWGSGVFPMGYPGERRWDVSPRAGAVTRHDGVVQVTFESTSVSEGNSGGALLDTCGRIVGMVTHVAKPEARATRIELVLKAIRSWDLPVTLKLSESPCDLTSPTPPKPEAKPDPAKASPADAVIYAVDQNNNLLWYRHDGREDGTPNWAGPEGKNVGTGWTFTHVFSGGDGIIYAVKPNGELLWYRHDGRGDGTPRWATEGKVVGTGWNVKHVFSGGDGIIYAVAANDDLLWNRHEGREDGTPRWASTVSKVVGNGWAFRHVFSGGDGYIYAVTPKAELLWFKHDGRHDGSYRWATDAGRVVGTGWNVRHVFSGGNGVIYSVMPNGELMWHRHEGRQDGSFRWAAPGVGKNVGTGWMFRHVFSGTGR